jgi:Na+-driven multidrug efflux pump
MLSSIQELIFRALVILSLPRYYGYVGICLSSPIAWLAAAILLVVAYHKKLKNLEKRFLQHSQVT